MKKEVLLYSTIYRFTSELFINQVNEAGDEDVTVRVNSPGGDVFAGWGMIAKLLEHNGEVTVKVDGIAASMAAFFVAFFENVECLDVSRIMIHRADAYVETDEERALLASINKDMKSKLAKKIDAAKLKELKGVTLEDIFAEDQRIDVWLTAKEAKQVGLVKKVVTLKPQEIEAYQSMWERVAAVMSAPEPPKSTPTKKNTDTMTYAEWLAAHPEHAKKHQEDTVKAERDRVSAWMAWAKVDAERVAKAIKDGDECTHAVISEMTVKMLSAKGLKDLADDSAEQVETGDPKQPKDQKAEATEAFFAEAKKVLGIK